MIPARSAVPPVKACTKVIMEPVFKGFVSINPEKLSIVGPIIRVKLVKLRPTITDINTP